MRCFSFDALAPDLRRYKHRRFLHDIPAARIEAARYSVALLLACGDRARRGVWEMRVTDSSRALLFTVTFG